MERDEQPASEPITARISAEVGAQVETERKRQSMTRVELAAAAVAAGAPETYTDAALRNAETARRGVSVDELLWLATALDVSPRDLLGEYADRFGASASADPLAGEVETALRESLKELGDLDGALVPLAAQALVLARALDGDAGMAVAAVSKELRALVEKLWEGLDDEEEEGPDYGPS
ncbi:hypothetical protein ACGFKZ_29370 [Micromonospora tulbaghiae]|uniref:hypothetical protein n=1 Tax=Micromonospora tulbaghiae TaxID=479978 RepID=UPI0037196A04